jgi:hypothetical protein
MFTSLSTSTSAVNTFCGTDFTRSAICVVNKGPSFVSVEYETQKKHSYPFDFNDRAVFKISRDESRKSVV